LADHQAVQRCAERLLQQLHRLDVVATEHLPLRGSGRRADGGRRGNVGVVGNLFDRHQLGPTDVDGRGAPHPPLLHPPPPPPAPPPPPPPPATPGPPRPPASTSCDGRMRPINRLLAHSTPVAAAWVIWLDGASPHPAMARQRPWSLSSPLTEVASPAHVPCH